MRYLPNNGYIFLRNLIYITIFSILFATISSSNLLAKDYYASGAVSITIPKTTEEVSFGPVKVVLQDVTKASEPSNIATVETDKVTLNPSGGTISKPGSDPNAKYKLGDNYFLIPLYYYFEKPKLNDNNKYRFCIADTTYCSASTSLNERGFVNGDIIFGGGGYEVEDLSSLTTSTGETAIPSSGDVNGGSTGKPTTCAIDGIGWIVCPVVNVLAKLTGNAYEWLENNYLEVKVSAFDTSIDNGTYSSWKNMRNVANVLFVIAFLVIIFSQMTGVGITNYGVKKMLPRLIIVAILVNISYFICQIAIDLSNIFGYSLKEFLSNVVPISEAAQTADVSTGARLSGIFISTLAIAGGGYLLFVSLATAIPVLIAGVISIMAILLILITRQVLIILLVVFSPIAFVAYLLPNTEDFFKKWQKIFISMLLVFPIIGLVFGGSTLASNILRNSSDASNTNSNMMEIAGAGMLLLPLLLVPSLLKKSLDGVGNIGATINGIGNHVGGALGKRAGDATGAAVERGWNRFDNAAMNGRAGMFGRARARILRRRSRTSSVDEFQKSELKRAQSEYIANLAGTDSEFRGRMSAGGAAGADMRAIAGATNTIAELDSKEVAAAATVIGKMNLNSKEKIALARGEDVTKNGYTLSGKDSAVRRAGIRSALATATVDEAEQIVRSSGNMSSSERREITSSLISTGLVNKATHLSGETLGKIEQGELGVSEAEIEKSLNDAVISNINKGKYSAEKLTANDAESLKRIENIMNDPSAIAAIGVDKYAGMIQEAVKAWTDPRLSGTTTKAQKEIINRLRFPVP